MARATKPSSATPPAFYFPQALIEAADADEAVEAYLDHWTETDLEAAKKHLALTAAASELLEACDELNSDQQLYSSLAHVYGEERAAFLCGKIRRAIAKTKSKAA